MCKTTRKGLLGIFSALTLAFWSSCAPEPDFRGTSNIVTAFRLTAPAAMGGKITIAEAYLKLNRLEVSGSFKGRNNTSLTHTVAADEPPYKLAGADSSHVSFAVSSRAYDQLNIHLFPFTDSYELVYLDGIGESPAPVENPGEEPGGEHEESDKQTAGQENNSGDADEGSNEEGTGNTGNSGDQGEDKDGSGNNNDSDDDSGDSEDDDKDESKDEHDDKDDEEKKDNKDKKDDKKKDDKKKKDKDEEDDDDDDERGDRTSRNGSNSTVDLDHFFQNAKPGLVVFGIYENNGKVISLILVVTDLEKLTIRGKQDDNFSIMLAESNTAELRFDPDYWFQSITPQDIEGAILQSYQQQDVLFIHPDHNTALYQALVSRIESSADFQISTPGSENL